MKAGKYRQAGRVLADGFRRDDSPRYPLLLAEVFFGLGKFSHAQLLLEEALRDPNVASYLPRNAAQHFPDDEAFDKQLKAIVVTEAKGVSLLHAYFLLHSRTPDAGLEILRQIVENEGNPLAVAAVSAKPVGHDSASTRTAPTPGKWGFSFPSTLSRFPYLRRARCTREWWPERCAPESRRIT